MPPLTLAVLASVLQMHGADATIGSDNKGIEDVLAPILGQLYEGADDPSEPTIMLARNFNKTYAENFPRGGSYERQFIKNGQAGPPYLKSMPRRPPIFTKSTQGGGLPGAGTIRR